MREFADWIGAITVIFLVCLAGFTALVVWADWICDSGWMECRSVLAL